MATDLHPEGFHWVRTSRVNSVAGFSGEVDLRVTLYLVHRPECVAIGSTHADEHALLANVVVPLADHREFREIDGHRLRDNIVVDTIGAWRSICVAVREPRQGSESGFFAS